MDTGECTMGKITISSKKFDIDVNNTECFDEALINFLKRSAEHGLNLDQVTTNVFDEVFSVMGEEPFDGSLSSFSMLMLDEMKVKRRIGSKILDVLMPAAVDGIDIYELIDRLEVPNEERTHKERYKIVTFTYPMIHATISTVSHKKLLE
jgi:hypothetical protein